MLNYNYLLKFPKYFYLILHKISVVTLMIMLAFSVNSKSNKSNQDRVPIDIEFEFEVDGKQLVLFGINNRLVNLDFRIHTRKDAKLISRFLIKPNEKIELFRFNTVKRKKAVKLFRKKYKSSYFFGSKETINPKLDYLYKLPYASNKTYRISQSFGGKSSHQSKNSFYSIDFDMKIGEAVHAAREGQVIVVIDWFNKGKRDKELTKKANKIVILHSDGTTGSYAHLMANGVVVKEGDFVKRGQHIGYSGNTGFTGGPHLHFTVRKEEDESIPIYFEEYPNEILIKDKFYTSE